jgi:hypothetical protein
MDALPDAFMLLGLQEAMGGCVVAILLGYVAPGAAGAEHREDGIDGYDGHRRAGDRYACEAGGAVGGSPTERR